MPDVQQRGPSKTGILENMVRDASEERKAAALRDAERDRDLLEASTARETRWYRLAVFELLCILALCAGAAGVGVTGSIPGVGEIGIVQTSEAAPAE
ncbi:MAG: hypothetical protein HRU00_12375 [Myxococcales bacterium]|nr:hypothetical protein [Myxococcales bacterium]